MGFVNSPGEREGSASDARWCWKGDTTSRRCPAAFGRPWRRSMKVTEATFERDVVERSRATPVVVDFWADWCAPCHMLDPVLSEAVEARAGGVALAKVDIDSNPALADRFAVRGIPAVKGFKNGRVAAEFVGVQSRQSVDAFLDTLTGPSAGE